MNNYGRCILVIVFCFFIFFAFDALAEGQQPIPKGVSIEAPTPYDGKYKDRFAGYRARGTTKSTVAVFQESFDGEHGFLTTESWAIGTPTTDSVSAYSTPNCAGTNLNGDYPNNSNDRLTSPSISLEAYSSGDLITLSFYHWYYLESCCDDANLRISTDSGMSWETIVTFTGNASDWISYEMDLSSFAGQTIMLDFQLTSDSSGTYKGWYVDDIQITVESFEPHISTELMDLNHAQFPSNVVLTLALNGEGFILPTLSQSDFHVFENDVGQPILEVIPPDESSGVRLADIVFVLDVTGSMSDEITQVKNNMGLFIENLDETGVNYTVGFVSYSDSVYVYNDSNLYSDNSEIMDIVNNITLGEHSLGYGGDGPENQLEAMALASTFNFREGSNKIIIMITDADAHEGDSVTSYTVSSCIDQLVAAGAVVYPVFNTGSSAQLTQYLPIVDATNPSGSYYNKTEDFTGIIEDISATISNTYIVRYNPTNNDYDGVERIVDVDIDYSGYHGDAQGSYMPGSRPKINRTADTIALENVSWDEGTSFTIRAEITDEYTPFVSGAELYYRTTGDSAYSFVEMTLVSGDTYEGVIPAGAVVASGVDYYITATDSQSTVTSPKSSPNINPYQIAILPNEPPIIVHIPMSALTVDEPVTITAEVTDTTTSLDQVEIYYRIFGHFTYEMMDMIDLGSNVYEEAIPFSFATAQGLEYYIEATDNFGVSTTHGTFDNPHVLVVANSSGLSLIDTRGYPGSIVTINLTLDNADGIDVSAVSSDLTYDTSILSNPSVVIGPAGEAAGKATSSSFVDSDTYRIGIVGLSNSNVISDGIVAYISFDVSPSAEIGTTTVITQGAGASSPDGEIVSIEGFSGTITISTCTGDCNEDGEVIISEVQAAINQYLGTHSVQPCNDENGDGTVSISEVQTVLNNYLGVVDQLKIKE